MLFFVFFLLIIVLLLLLTNKVEYIIIVLFFTFIVTVRCCHRRAGYVASYQMHFSAKTWLRRVHCNGYETNITHCSLRCAGGQCNIARCSLGYSSICNDDRVARVSCITSKWCIIFHYKQQTLIQYFRPYATFFQNVSALIECSLQTVTKSILLGQKVYWLIVLLVVSVLTHS